ncbi:MAG: ribonuclease HII [Gammaproteobacteria bacterium]|nr:ribonuclease HII [Gammaproteobacteria bacterium]
MYIGIDEVGRGPLAGPVIACAVLWPDDGDLPGLTDSKRLSARRRQALIAQIKETALGIGIGRAEPTEIDQLNILRATFLAMTRAVDAIAVAIPNTCPILIDGNQVPSGLGPEARAIVGGDGLIPGISAASVVAKVTRDDEMAYWGTVYPGYGFEQHVGYPTRAHLDALSSLGATPIHRRSFAPVARCLQEQS